jgi:cell division protein FtsW
MIPEAIREGDDTTPSPAPLLAQQAPRAATSALGIDLVLLGAVLTLLCVGTVEIYSASAVNAASKMGSSTYFLTRHLVYLGMGFFAMFVAIRTDFSILRRLTYPMLGGALFMLVAVLFIGHRVGGAIRWFHLGPMSFQPVELAKLALVCYLANSLARKREKVRTFTVGFMPHLAVCGLMMVLLLKQPDLGSSLILGATTLIMLFVAGTRVSYILLAVMAAAPIVYQAVVGTPWRLKRMIAFLDPWQFREGVGYQITESLISIGSGGFFGLGLGDGKQKLFYMPEAHNDFIMSNIGEELGFVGFAVVLSCYVIILWRGVRAALNARDAFGTFLAFGLTSIFCLQALVNTGVVLGALPAKGLTLPFVSYGGTSLVMAMFFAGVILNVSKRAPAPAVHRVKRIKNDNRRRKRVRVAAETHGASTV